MSDLEMEQVRMTLTDDPSVLTALRTRKQMKRDADGEYYSVVFNSQELRFRENQPRVLGKTIASALMRSNYIIVGDDLTGDMVHILKPHDSYNLNDLIAEQQTCDYCKKQFETPKRLAAHMLDAHREEFEEPSTPEQVVKEPAKTRATPKSN